MQPDFEFMQFHVAALFAHDASGRIVSTNESEPDRAPRLYLGRTAEGNLWRFHADLPNSLVRRLDQILQREPIVTDRSQLERPPVTLPELREAIATSGAIKEISSGPCWYFPEEIEQPANVIEITAANVAATRKYFAYIADHLSDLQPCFAVVVEGDAVAMCSTVRIPDRATEAGVYTEEPFRGHG